MVSVLPSPPPAEPHSVFSEDTHSSSKQNRDLLGMAGAGDLS